MSTEEKATRWKSLPRWARLTGILVAWFTPWLMWVGLATLAVAYSVPEFRYAPGEVPLVEYFKMVFRITLGPIWMDSGGLGSFFFFLPLIIATAVGAWRHHWGHLIALLLVSFIWHLAGSGLLV